MSNPQRDEMLAGLLRAMRRRNRRRRLARRALATATLVVAAAVATQAWTFRAPPGERVTVPAPASSAFRIRRVSGRTGLVRTIDDQELIERLNEIDRPTGLIRLEGRTMLVSR